MIPMSMRICQQRRNSQSQVKLSSLVSIDIIKQKHSISLQEREREEKEEKRRKTWDDIRKEKEEENARYIGDNLFSSPQVYRAIDFL